MGSSRLPAPGVPLMLTEPPRARKITRFEVLPVTMRPPIRTLSPFPTEPREERFARSPAHTSLASEQQAARTEKTILLESFVIADFFVFFPQRRNFALAIPF